VNIEFVSDVDSQLLGRDDQLARAVADEDDLGVKPHSHLRAARGFMA